MSFIREPAVSGAFYPDNPKTLRQDIERYLDNAVFDAVRGKIVGVISPHAGYMYSGPVAAYGYKSLQGSAYDTVIVVAPSHRAYFDGVAIQDKGSCRTPLGLISIDEEISEGLLKENKLINVNMKAHTSEHSLEVQLPFLQVVLKDFMLVPLIMGTQDISTCEKLAGCIWNVIQGSSKSFLLIGSTDLSHYYAYTEAVKLDSIVVKHLEAFDIKGLAGDFEGNKCEACGSGPMIVTMMVSEKIGASSSKVLKYANSGDTSGDKSRVVGYVSGVFYKPVDA